MQRCRSMSTAAPLLAILLIAGQLLAGCNDYPVHSLLDSFEARVTSRLAHNQPIKLDFLWVIDHSPSMCSHQVDLSNGFQNFIGALQKAGQIDAQMAVVSVQQMADRDLTSPVVIKKVGQFVNTPATKFPPNCIERFKIPCAKDSDCQNGMDYTFKADGICPQSTSCVDPVTGSSKKHFDNKFQSVSCAGDATCQWRCKSPEKAIYAVNDNCSINSYCWRHCKSDQECRDVFEPNVPIPQQRMKCFNPGGPPSEQSGCQFPPPTADCPTADKLPTVMKNNQLNLFKCIATVGASQTQESKFEGGLRSAWMALDPNGPNCPRLPATKEDPLGLRACQYHQLIRPDAHLVIAVVSDDDDCSVNLKISMDNATTEQHAALKAKLPLEVWDSCQKLGDEVGGNQWLNEGNCEYLKGKPGQPKRCPCDCRALTAQKFPKSKNPEADGQSDPDVLACWKEVRADLPKYAKVDHRFASVNEFVNKFRSLKNDPAKVIFAAVTGFSKMGKPGQDPLRPGDRSYDDGVAYFKSSIKNVATLQAPSVCGGVRGEAGFGTRYVQVADAFKENGVVVNICSGEDFGEQLQTIATTILKRVVKICLPAPPDFVNAKPKMLVTRKRGNVPSVLAYASECAKGGPDSYTIQDSADCLVGKGSETLSQGQTSCKSNRDCSTGLTCLEGLCRIYNKAIFFCDVLAPGDEVDLNYHADMGL